jgi:hypothetical protein
MPFEEKDTRREYRLEVRIGGEVFWQSIVLSAMEVKHHPRASSTIKRELVDRFIGHLRSQIYEQIGTV